MRVVETLKRRMPAITLLESQAISYALVLARNPHGEHFTSILGKMNLPVLVTKVGTKDEPHASFILQNLIVHYLLTLGLTDSRQGASLHYCNKKPRAQVSGLSLSSCPLRRGGKGLARRYGLWFCTAKIAINSTQCIKMCKKVVKWSLFRIITN